MIGPISVGGKDSFHLELIKEAKTDKAIQDTRLKLSRMGFSDTDIDKLVEPKNEKH